MMEEELKAVKKRLKALEEQIKTISAPTPRPRIKAEIETKIKTETENKTTPKKDHVDQATLKVLTLLKRDAEIQCLTRYRIVRSISRFTTRRCS
jgi:hypothetical protein